MVTVTLVGKTVAEVQDQMRHFLVGALLSPQAIPQEKVDQILTQAQEPEVQERELGKSPALGMPYGEDAKPVEDKPKRTRTTKAKETVAASPTPSEPVVEKAAPVEAKPTADLPIVVAGKESVHQALQQVNVAVGLNKAREILQEFKINRISEIKPEQYKAFVEKCNEAVMMHG